MQRSACSGSVAQKVWPLLKHSDDPRVRSYLIHRFASLDADARQIVRVVSGGWRVSSGKNPDKKLDITIRRALILSLGSSMRGAASADAQGKPCCRSCGKSIVQIRIRGFMPLRIQGFMPRWSGYCGPGKDAWLKK